MGGLQFRSRKYKESKQAERKAHSTANPRVTIEKEPTREREGARDSLEESILGSTHSTAHLINTEMARPGP